MYSALLLSGCCLILAVSGAVVPGPDEKLPAKQESTVQQDAPAENTRIRTQAPAQKSRVRAQAPLNTIDDSRKKVATPRPHIAILKHVNRLNTDGSYTYGYQGADGSFKIETRYATGEVKGKYGYIDADGEVIEITYGAASNRGFEPVVPGVEVPPPVINDYDYEYYDNYVQTEAPAPVRQRKPTRRQPSRVKVNRRLRPQPAREQQAAPSADHADVPRVAPRTRPQIAAPGKAVAPRAQPARQEFVPAPVQQQARPAPVQQQARPAPVQQQARPAPFQQQARPAAFQQQARPIPFQQQAPVQFNNQDFSYNVPGSHSVQFSLPSFFTAGGQRSLPQGLNTGSYSLTIGGRR